MKVCWKFTSEINS